ncbi:hypothetical protein EMIHUDRAFT_116378 [Emiliania huxleyi CCMP1516]|uniref:Major facilitator superfamily (MFS) profile domain-containing protein n=2 Tax=Emiliania huxleyi TaxID=2903 RepID=A0A0D3JJ32_EMIH1|nr:hypothetical protein EMIHUDRAFT_116378 [Emiliania huxleyi CCMP1516]EOD23517.1 hypothetical protein EMIHUDRAFT_116378 [Emiliania huxleyi CCMP1516]|eukprot:XP_005775946.1 hypothetical protein EMIHUDRAFT_116378 [Emiliania huxleyi CCMP1516]
METAAVWLAFVLGSACGLLYIGAICGWGAISVILEADGVCGDACAPGEELPCPAQNNNLLLIYTIAMSAMNLSGTPGGILCDKCGVIGGAAAAGVAVILGAAAVGVLDSSDSTMFQAAFVLMACGGNTTFFAALKMVFMFPQEKHATILSTICALYDASSAVPLLFFLAFSAGASREAIFLSYAASAAVLFAAWIGALLYVRSAGAAPDPKTSRAAGLSKDSFVAARLSAMQGRGSVMASERFTSTVYQEMPSAPSEHEVPTLHTSTLTGMLTSSQFFLGLLWFVLSAQRCNLYLGTVKYVLEEQGDDDNKYMAILTAMLPLGLACVPVIAFVHDKLKLLGSMQAVTALGMVYGLCAIFLPLHLQPITFVLFAGYRAAVFSVFCIYATHVFGPLASGTVNGVIFFIGGIASMSLAPISSFVNGSLDGDWSPVYHTYSALCLVQLVAVSLAARWWRRAR